ncbi:MAG: hypothetical protein K6L76_12235 [Agarilytica sp.]
MKALIALLLTLSLVSCTTIDELKSTKTYTPKTLREGKVNVDSRATGVSPADRVGMTTVLFIPVGGIKAEGDTSANIMKSVSEALEAAGYNSDDSSYSSSDAGYLRAHVKEIEFGNFLFLPFATWGTIVLNLHLETRDGEVLWSKRIRTSVSAINNYDRTAIVTMNRLVRDLTRTFSNDSFYQSTLRIKRYNEFLKEDTPITMHQP